MNADGQIETFIITIVTGMFLGLTFDLYRVLRALFRPRWLLASLADLGYWLLATGMVFLALLFGNWGDLRLYAFLGLALGALGYYRLLSRQAIRLLIGMLRLAASALRAVRTVIVYMIFKPAAYLAGVVVGPVRYLKGKIAARRSPPDGGVPPG